MLWGGAQGQSMGTLFLNTGMLTMQLLGDAAASVRGQEISPEAREDASSPTSVRHDPEGSAACEGKFWLHIQDESITRILVHTPAFASCTASSRTFKAPVCFLLLHRESLTTHGTRHEPAASSD